MARDKAEERETEPEPKSTDERNFIPSDEELTAPTSDDVGEQTKTSADEAESEEEG